MGWKMAKTVGKDAKAKASASHPLYRDMVLDAIISNGHKKVSRQAILKHVIAKYSLNFDAANRNIKKILKQLLEEETILPSAEAGKKGAGSFKMTAASVHAYQEPKPKEAKVVKKSKVVAKVKSS